MGPDTVRRCWPEQDPFRYRLAVLRDESNVSKRLAIRATGLGPTSDDAAVSDAFLQRAEKTAYVFANTLPRQAAACTVNEDDALMIGRLVAKLSGPAELISTVAF